MSDAPRRRACRARRARREPARTPGHERTRTRPSVFVPSPAQVRTLEVFLAADDRPSIRQLCELAGIHNSTFYRWMQRPAFRRWWNEGTETVLRGARSAVLAALTRRAEDGDLSAIKVWLQRFDRVDSGDRQTLQDAYRDLIRRFASDEYLTQAAAEDDAEAEACADEDEDEDDGANDYGYGYGYSYGKDNDANG